MILKIVKVVNFIDLSIIITVIIVKGYHLDYFRCIQQQDHHCQYLNVCVGVKNYKYFMMTVVLAFINLLVYLISFGIAIQQYRNSQMDKSLVGFIFVCIGGLVVIGAQTGITALLVFHIYLNCNNLSTRQFVNKTINPKRIRIKQIKQLTNQIKIGDQIQKEQKKINQNQLRPQEINNNIKQHKKQDELKQEKQSQYQIKQYQKIDNKQKTRQINKEQNIKTNKRQNEIIYNQISQRQNENRIKIRSKLSDFCEDEQIKVKIKEKLAINSLNKINKGINSLKRSDINRNNNQNNEDLKKQQQKRIIQKSLIIGQNSQIQQQLKIKNDSLNKKKRQYDKKNRQYGQEMNEKIKQGINEQITYKINEQIKQETNKEIKIIEQEQNKTNNKIKGNKIEKIIRSSKLLSSVLGINAQLINQSKLNNINFNVYNKRIDNPNVYNNNLHVNIHNGNTDEKNKQNNILNNYNQMKRYNTSISNNNSMKNLYNQSSSISQLSQCSYKQIFTSSNKHKFKTQPPQLFNQHLNHQQIYHKFINANIDQVPSDKNQITSNNRKDSRIINRNNKSLINKTKQQNKQDLNNQQDKQQIQDKQQMSVQYNKLKNKPKQQINNKQRNNIINNQNINQFNYKPINQQYKTVKKQSKLNQNILYPLNSSSHLLDSSSNQQKSNSKPTKYLLNQLTNQINQFNQQQYY